MEGLHIISPSFACVDCQFDEDVPRDDPTISRLTVFEGNMVCLYHLPIRVELWNKSQRNRRRKKTENVSVGDVVYCGKVYRKETHVQHYWTMQPEDDSPRQIKVFCTGYH